MRSVQANFAPARAPSRRAWRWACLAFAPSLALLGSWILMERAADVERTAAEQVRLAAEARQTVVEPLPVPAKPYADSAGRMLAQRTAPWPEALAALETIPSRPVVESLEWEAARGSLRVVLTLPAETGPTAFLEELGAGETGAPDELTWRLVEVRAAEGKRLAVTVLAARRSTPRQP